MPGHGPLANKAQLTDFSAMMKTARDRMTTLIAEGKSEAEATTPSRSPTSTQICGNRTGQQELHAGDVSFAEAVSTEA